MELEQALLQQRLVAAAALQERMVSYKQHLECIPATNCWQHNLSVIHPY
jgi:hypothetical protein